MVLCNKLLSTYEGEWSGKKTVGNGEKKSVEYLVEIVAAGPNMAITLPAYMAQSSLTRA